ncbi:hypothetical protein ABE424_16420 [Stenotrophomonas sp. TWI1149]|uniref:helix-turn-helix transcriptional regulator n=1 Tax=unclassified Stenotrophomonas TaxID=196198 RepID=UPI00320A449B
MTRALGADRSPRADTAPALARFFETSEGFWMNLKMVYDAAKARDELAEVLSRIVPYHHKT